MGNKPTGLAWNLPPSQRPSWPVPAIFLTPVSVPLPFIVIAHGAMGARPWCGGRSPMGRWATGISGTGTEIKGVGTRIKGLESQIRGVKRREKGETEKHKGTNFRNPLSHTAINVRYIIWAKNKEWIIGRGPNYSFFIFTYPFRCSTTRQPCRLYLNQVLQWQCLMP